MKRRFSVKIHPVGLALFAAAFLFADSHLALAALAALFLHEGAHLVAMLLCGMKGFTVEITPFGGMMDAQRFEAYPPWKQMAASGAGVAASALAAYLCMRWLPYTLFTEAFFQANCSLAFLNALPLWPLDGARVITALAAYVGVEHSVKKLLSCLTAALGVFFVLLGLYGVWKGIVNPSLLAAGPYLCYAARAETVSAKVRRLGGIERKLSNEAVLPVALWAGSEESISEQFAARLGRSGENRYQVMIAVDPSSGKIQKWWTEQEMLNHLMMNGRN